jgi:hypothetical protein
MQTFLTVMGYKDYRPLKVAREISHITSLGVGRTGCEP